MLVGVPIRRVRELLSPGEESLPMSFFPILVASYFLTHLSCLNTFLEPKEEAEVRAFFDSRMGVSSSF